MPVWRLQSSFQMDSAFPRDRLVITPHFDDAGVGTDPQGLCQDLATALAAWSAVVCEVRVTAYDAQGTPPVFPQGEAIVNAAQVGNSLYPRELAVCLSYYATDNRPRQRGRLYIPLPVMGIAGTSQRPGTAHRDKVAELPAIFADLGGLDVDWVVYSRRDNVARPVSNWYVDDEWDVIRSRGLRPNERTAGTVGEG